MNSYLGTVPENLEWYFGTFCVHEVYISTSNGGSAPLPAGKSWASYLAVQTLNLIVYEMGVIIDPTA